ncbi:glutamate-gated chloride channel alpha [Eurytemora carolleeae]|uniref:glutamate-gated chloride channel alpha n=1 Tax=Eurytemora carolleeae TaxID=1294199 RepID=UPI000C77D231|nr:glutamate-gated chloride channel alpha [Eurytemora carolleeae]|eukprot:XP_023330915.1 glutamate-gated chloride channel alpha-like [Eurytemora affinis]
MMKWYDYRLSYFNLKTTKSSNALSESEIQKIWIPHIVFINTESNEATVIGKGTEVTVTREGNFTRSSSDVMEEINIFQGKENILEFQEVYTKTFKCEYELQMYPFDTQKCQVVMMVRDLEKRVLMITPDSIMMEGDTVLTQYIILSWKLDYVNQTSPTDGITVGILLKRRIINEILTTFLPSFLLIVIVYTTNFFKPFFFEALVTVNLTALLVLTTLFISVSGSLPPTAYVKMIDIWLIFAQMIPFFEVLLHTYMDSKRKEQEVNHHGSRRRVKPKSPIMTSRMYERSLMARNEEVEVNARKRFYASLYDDEFHIRLGEITAKICLPVFIFIFSLVYWTYGLSYYFSNGYYL